MMNSRFGRRALSVLMALSMVLPACAGSAAAFAEGTPADAAVTASTDASTLAGVDNTKWQYNADSDVYWQVGISYCSNPADESYETLGIFVPGAYMTAADNGDGTFTCAVNAEAEVNGYTAATAPVVLPINTPGYSAQNAPTGFVSEAATYASEGFVYVDAGCRGRDAGAPAGVTDLKAAVRFIRSCAEDLPGDMDSIFTFGMSGGGAQSALMGATGDSALYDPYLEAIGAVMDESDAVAGSMCWCPITNLDVADEAYEWNMGVTRTGLTEDQQTLSDGLAAAFAEYINELGLTDADGTVLTLTASEDGIYQAGTYYESIRGLIETSLENFLQDTTFPYDASSASGGRTGFGGMNGGAGGFMKDGEKPDGMPDGALPDGNGMPEGAELPEGNGMPEGAELPEGNLPDNAGPTGETLPDGAGMSAADAEAAQYAQDGIARDSSSSGLSLSGTYETAQDYIDALNADGEWVSYDASTGEVTVSSVAEFVKRFKTASKSLGAFDQLDAGQGENTLFGYGDGSGAHFDATLAGLVTGTEYEAAFTEDLAKEDAAGNTVDVRLNMYNPMYYLCSYYDGCGTSTVAKYWRIRTGIDQSDTALCTEADLALALEASGADVDFATVWGLGHTQAERSGDSTTNFIAWVNACMQG